MATISFQNETQFQQRTLTPFGCAPAVTRFCDSIAATEREHAQAAAICFGRRDQAPARKSSPILFKSAA
jgi:hypothetical protein